MSHVVGVDLGGTKTAAALVGADGQVGTVLTVPTPARSGPDAILDSVAALIGSVLAQAADRGPVPRLAAVGIGTAGVVDAGRGTIVSATDVLPGWAGTDVAGGVRARLAGLPGAVATTDLPVVVENDVDAHAAGEAWLGAAAGARIALMVAVGTGVGGAVVLEGTPLRGAHHLAGEMGHMPVPGADDLLCGCGRPGHLEALGSGPALHRHYLRLGGDPAAADTRAVVARATGGDPLAQRAVAESAACVGRAIAAICTVLDPDVVVIGGGLAEAGPQWWSPMLRALRADVIEPLAELPVLPAALGSQAAIVGAAGAAHRVLGRMLPLPRSLKDIS